MDARIGSRRSWLAALAPAVLSVALATPAAAQPRPASPPAAPPKRAAQPAPAPPSGDVLGTVLDIQGTDLIVDLGTDQGAVEGEVIEIWRPLKLKHPVSGKTLTDRFRIGALRLGQVRKTMSLATAEGDLTRPPQAGDVVILPRRAASPEAPPGQGADPMAEGPAPTTREEVEARAIARMLDELRGADLVTRIRRYEDYVRSQPNGRFARVLYEEAAALRQLVGGERPAEPRERDPRAQMKSFHRPTEVVAGTALRFGIEVSDDTSGAVLHLRQAGEPAYQSVPMIEAGTGYFVATVPGDRLAPPRVEYFIEGTTPKGDVSVLVGAAESPESVEVHDVPKHAPPRKLDARVELLSDFADYNRLRGNDQVWQTEGYFGLRYGDTGVRALRTGFGVYRGIGGSIRELDELGLEGRKVGLTYGYLETEIGAVRAFSIIGKLSVGLLDDGVSGGGQLLFRIGSDQGTNLLLGGELLRGVGLRSITQLEWSSFERVPIVLRTEVTNQPAGAAPSDEQRGKEGTSQDDGEVGVRGIVQVGFKVIPSLTLSVRGSFQGRTIKHAGPGFGAAVGYTW